jgi:hypothetical protein
VGWRTYDQLMRQGHFSADCWAPTRPSSPAGAGRGVGIGGRGRVVIPPLFDMYLRYGGKSQPPALDREFRPSISW